ncbi:MAG: hypothetical protein WAX69_16105 [Victivallales bacterium]
MSKPALKHILSATLITSIIILTAGCFSFRKENNDKNIAQLVEHFKKSGLMVDMVQSAMFDVIRAQDGVSLKIDGVDVQIFKYDTKEKVQNEKLEKIVKKGSITILGVDFSSKVNGSFIMLNYKGHPDEQRLLEAFESF